MVGSKALGLLSDAGANVVVTDIDPAKVQWAKNTYGVEAVEPDAIYACDVDIFAPYALGGIINDDTLAQFKVKVVAGAANNILLEERHGDELERRGIVYAVDYVANSGGTIYDTDRLRKGGFQPERALAKVREIYGRTHEVFAIAERDGIPCYQAADRLAEARIAALTAVKLLG